MKNKKLIAGIGCGVLVAALVIGLAVGGNKNSNNTANNTDKNIESSDEGIKINDNITNEPLISEDGINLTMTEENFEQIKTYMSNITDGSLIRELDDVELNGNEMKTTPISRYDFFLLNSSKDYYTVDITGIYNDPRLKSDNSNYIDLVDDYKCNTEEIFKTSFDNCQNIYDAALCAASAANLDINTIINGKLDKNMYDAIYEEYGQKLYRCKVTEQFNVEQLELYKNDYDTIEEIDSLILTDISTSGDEYIHFLQINVYYTKNEKNFVRQFYISTRFWDDDNTSMPGCDCSQTSGCNLGTQTPCDIDCEMEDKIE